MNYGQKKKLQNLANIKNIQVLLKNHNEWINCICLVDSNRFASCSNDGTIKIWDIKNFKCLLTFEGNQSFVSYISKMSNGYLVSSGLCKINIWDINNKKLVCMLNKHKAMVSKVAEISKNRLCSCSSDWTLMIYNNYPPYQHISTLIGHQSIVCSFIELKNKEYILSSSYYAKEIRIWSNQTYQCQTRVANISCSTGKESLLELDNNIVIIGTDNGAIVLETLTFQIKNKISNIGCVDCMIKVFDEVILCGGKDGELIEINVSKNKIIHTKKKAHTKCITCLLILNGDMLGSSSKDGTIKVWK